VAIVTAPPDIRGRSGSPGPVSYLHFKAHWLQASACGRRSGFVGGLRHTLGASISGTRRLCWGRGVIGDSQRR